MLLEPGRRQHSVCHIFDSDIGVDDPSRELFFAGKTEISLPRSIEVSLLTPDPCTITICLLVYRSLAGRSHHPRSFAATICTVLLVCGIEFCVVSHNDLVRLHRTSFKTCMKYSGQGQVYTWPFSVMVGRSGEGFFSRFYNRADLTHCTSLSLRTRYAASSPRIFTAERPQETIRDIA